MKDMAFITTVAYPRQRPHYWVRFAKSINRKPVLISHKRFYWHDYEGGEEEALFWAKDWRDWEYRDLRSRGLIQVRGSWVKGIPPCYTAPRAGNTSGKCGVQRYDYISHKKYVCQDGTVSYHKKHNLCYAAVWIEYEAQEGVIRRRYRNKAFSIKKFGEAEARRMACEARDKVERYLQSPRHTKLRLRYQKNRSS